MARVKWLIGKSVIITGASSGIGRDLTKILIEEYHCTVIGIGRDESKLKAVQNELKGLSNLFSYKTFDVSDESRWIDFAKELKFSDRKVDILINNAGVLPPFKKSHDYDTKDIASVMNINFYGAIYGINSMWDIISQSNTPSIINITSAAALCALSGTSVYSASKSALKSYTEAMQNEYKDVFISFVCPGLTKSAIFRNQTHSTKDSRISMLSMDSYKMAKKIVKGIVKKKKRMVIGMDACFMDGLYRLMPKFSRKLLNGILKSAKIDLYKDVYK